MAYGGICQVCRNFVGNDMLRVIICVGFLWGSYLWVMLSFFRVYEQQSRGLKSLWCHHCLARNLQGGLVAAMLSCCES
jgi:hypothetical protein